MTGQDNRECWVVLVGDQQAQSGCVSERGNALGVQRRPEQGNEDAGYAGAQTPVLFQSRTHRVCKLPPT